MADQAGQFSTDLIQVGKRGADRCVHARPTCTPDSTPKLEQQEYGSLET